MEMICGIYKIKNQINNKVYIGQSIDIYTRWYNHKHDLRNGVHYNTHLQKSWDKYGEENFEFSIIEVCDQNNLDALEIEYIAYYQSHSAQFGYNMSSGGIGGGIPNEETRKKLSQVNSGENNPMFGKKHTEETKSKIRQKKVGDKNYMYGKRGENSPSYGRKHTEAELEKMRNVNKGKHMSDAFRKKQSQAKSGQNNPRSKAVYCPELDEYFWGAQEVQDKYGISRNGVANCCKGKQKTAGKHPITGEKLHWVYVDELQKMEAA